MPRTYSHTHDPHHVFEADTIKGFTPEEVDAAIKKAEDTTATATEIDAAVNKLKRFFDTGDDINCALYGKNGEIRLGFHGILGDANNRDVANVYSHLNLLRGLDGAGNMQYLLVALQPYYSASSYYFRRLSDGTFDEQMPIVTSCQLNKPTSSEINMHFPACFARPYSIKLSQIEGGTLFTTGALDIAMTDDEIESCPLTSQQIVSKVYVEGLALNSFVNSTWNGVVYADAFSGMGITKPVFMTCALTATGIHLTAVPFT